jgi:hypothetical protein
MKSLLDIIKEKQVYYDQKCKEWSLTNPGAIMCNYCNNLYECNTLLKYPEITVKELEILSEAALIRAKMMTTMDGFYTAARLYKQIIEEYHVQDII